MVPWNEWNPGPIPVPLGARVEVLTQDRRRAFGVAAAFNWGGSYGTPVVLYWRFYMPNAEHERTGTVLPRPPALPWL